MVYVIGMSTESADPFMIHSLNDTFYNFLQLMVWHEIFVIYIFMFFNIYFSSLFKLHVF